LSRLLSQIERVGPPVPRLLVHLDPLHLPAETTDVLVVGGGVAGLSAAISAGERRNVLVLLKDGREETATAWAQGGMAAALEPEDSPAQHGDDTRRVAGGLAHDAVVDIIVDSARDLVNQWLSWDGRFDRDSEGELRLAMEGGHSTARILHADGDQTGREIQRLLVARAAGMPSITVHDRTFVLDLVTEGECVRGVIAWSHRQGYHVIWAGSTILCNGGLGQIYRETSNPPGATGDGLAMAYRAGARLRGLEFVQFHPTVLYVAGMGRMLVSETARGEGGLLVDRTGHRFMPDYHADAELAPRDVVSRAIMRQLAEVRDSHVYLDMRHLDGEFLKKRFPVISRACREFGLDMGSDLIPVHPACHYMVGGVETDTWGRASLTGLYACGEVASTGFHGANRMGSNSLLEGAVMGDRAGRHAAESCGEPAMGRDAARLRTPSLSGALDVHDLDASLRSLMWRLVSIEREGDRLQTAERQLAYWSELVSRRVLGDPFGWMLTNKLLVSRLVTSAALARCESRGTHFRRDFPETDDAEWLRDLAFVRPGPSAPVQSEVA
jgi:L-aspartate oxidase